MLLLLIVALTGRRETPERRRRTHYAKCTTNTTQTVKMMVPTIYLGHLKVVGPERFHDFLVGLNLRRHRRPYAVQDPFERKLLHGRGGGGSGDDDDGGDGGRSPFPAERSPHDHGTTRFSNGGRIFKIIIIIIRRRRRRRRTCSVGHCHYRW